jgi:hypothetical protein
MKKRIFLPIVLLGFFLSGNLIAEEIKKAEFWAITLSPLSASGNKKGDHFNLQVLEPAAYKNSIIEGEVIKAKAAGKVKGKSELLFSFNKLMLPNGTMRTIVADLTQVKNSRGVQNVDEEGRVIGKSSQGKDIGRTAALAGVGALIGGLAAGGKGVAAGAAIGAAAGLAITFSTKGEDIRFAQGAQFQLSVSSQDKESKKEASTTKATTTPAKVESSRDVPVSPTTTLAKKNIEPIP